MAANNSRVWKMRASGYPMGWMMSPVGGWRIPFRDGVSMPFALDNGLYHAPTEPPKGMKALPPFYQMVRKCHALGHRPLFVVSPDVPYHMDQSRKLSAKHIPILRGLVDWPIAVAVQDGATPDDLDGYQAVFIAGSTEWKWRTASMWCDQARQRSMWSHVARVNTWRRIQCCQDMGADSADGTGIWRGDMQQLGDVLRALIQPTLFGAEHALASV